jgi:hypothetical protein
MYKHIEHYFQFFELGEHDIRGFGPKQIYRLESMEEAANDRHRFV